MEIEVKTMRPDGSWSSETIELGEDVSRQLEEAQAYWQELKDAGTPYWCIHEGRGVDHPRAYWRGDNPSHPIRRKHGVFCLDCDGYIQEG
jgi:hypothetical protein